EWRIIIHSRQSGKLLNHHYLSEAWEEMESFLKQKIKLYYFLDEKQQGLVAQSFTYWLFFSPATAAEFFKQQPEKPKNFSAQAIRTVPFPNLLEAFNTGFLEIVDDDKLHNWQKIEKSADLLKLSDLYLQKEDAVKMDETVKKKIIQFLSPEIAELQEEVISSVSAPKIVQKRLKGVLRFGWRYFKANNELETKYFRKLMSNNGEERLKGLKLAKKKLIDYELDMAE
ncbi:MAG: hypothetical protein ABIK68_23280, partial [bacterium]